MAVAAVVAAGVGAEAGVEVAAVVVVTMAVVSRVGHMNLMDYEFHFIRGNIIIHRNNWKKVELCNSLFERWEETRFSIFPLGTI